MLGELTYRKCACADEISRLHPGFSLSKRRPKGIQIVNSLLSRDVCSRRNRRCFKSGPAFNDRPLLMSLNGPGSVNCNSDGRLDASTEDRLTEFSTLPGSSPCGGGADSAGSDAASERYFISRQPWLSVPAGTACRSPRLVADQERVIMDAVPGESDAGRRRLCPFHQLLQLSSTSLTTATMPSSFKHPAGSYVSITSGRPSDTVDVNQDLRAAAEEGENRAEHSSELLHKRNEGRPTDFYLQWANCNGRQEACDHPDDSVDEYDGDASADGASATFDGSATLDLIRGSSTTSAAVAPQAGDAEAALNLLPATAAGTVATSEQQQQQLPDNNGSRRIPGVSWSDSIAKSAASTSVTGGRVAAAAAGRVHGRSLSVQQ